MSMSYAVMDVYYFRAVNHSHEKTCIFIVSLFLTINSCDLFVVAQTLFWRLQSTSNKMQFMAFRRTCG